MKYLSTAQLFRTFAASGHTSYFKKNNDNENQNNHPKSRSAVTNALPNDDFGLDSRQWQTNKSKVAQSL